MPDSSQIPLLPLAASAISAGILSAGSLLAYSVFAPRCQFWAPVIRSLPQRSDVALTFDDGPHPEFTPAILDILAKHHVNATFFVIGRHAQQHPDLVRRIHSEGHTLGNHSYDHDSFGVNRNRAYWREQVFRTQEVLARITGALPLLFRPPMGFKTWHIAAAAAEARLPVIGWSVRGLDARECSAEGLTRRVLRKVSGHDIVLLQDGSGRTDSGGPGRGGATQQQTVAALPAILGGIRAKELQIVPLLEALVAGAHWQKEAAARLVAREGGTA